ncbi:MAG: hypothetical protein H6843_00880 [Rhodospirillaceae bacterium]|nr:hypothetical protein [Rhodospirillaceae bacterium]
MRITFGLMVLVLGAWGSLAIVAGRHGIHLWPSIPWLAAALGFAGPWVSLIGGFLLWRQARIWRRLQALRRTPQPLSRDPHRPLPPPDRPSALEHTALIVLVLGAAALVYRLGLARPGQVLAAGALAWWFARSALRVLAGR